MSNKIISVLFVITLATTSLTSSASTLIKSMTDSSGKVTVAVFEQISPNYRQHYTDYAVNVPDDFVVIGGGAEGAHVPTGNLITASYPNAQLSAWLVSTKDHSHPQAIKLKAYAIGLKIAGLSRSQLLQHISVNVATSSWGSHPDITAGVSAGHRLIGGGIKVNWSGYGNLATASYPSNSFGWRAQSKDHSVSSYATTQAYAIGIRDYIAGVGTIGVDINTAGSSYAAHPASSVGVQHGYALTGCGAKVHWSGAGNLLWKLKPLTQISQHGCEASSKDHSHSSPATITSYALGIKVL
ncbi:hypothetical protein [Pleionea sp. CnH1-48]|uniref:hypothetical protein n=1 Tax=Pleionea sp. CnH1-48 TaxID=2954494 RepID=UPI0020979C30|nr:hypothetical protein [Pleionea sp. CnH1-48]MCO7223354.1 hypothetical protein [Pleionea sp. CnH1-48]